MTIEETLVSFLKTNANITALVSSRVYPHKPPVNATFPIVTYQRANTNAVNSHDGYSGLSAADFYLKSWSPNLIDAANIASTLKREIAGKGKLGDGSSVILENEIHLDDPDVNIYQSILTVRIWYRE